MQYVGSAFRELLKDVAAVPSDVRKVSDLRIPQIVFGAGPRFLDQLKFLRSQGEAQLSAGILGRSKSFRTSDGIADSNAH